jgi:Transposase IS4
MDRFRCIIISEIETSSDGKKSFTVRLECLPDIDVAVSAGHLKYEGPPPGLVLSSSTASSSAASSSVASSSTASSSIASASIALASLDISTYLDPAPPFDESETDTDDDEDLDSEHITNIGSGREKAKEFSWVTDTVPFDPRMVGLSYRAPTVVNVADISNASPAILFARFFPLVYVRDTVIPATNSKAASFDRNWRNLTVPEFYVWLGVLTAMTVVVLPRPFYWKKTAPFPLVHPLNFGRWMSGHRFNAILSYLTLVRVPDGNPADPLHAFRGFHVAFNSNLTEAITPSTYLTVDESMCEWKGRVNKMPYKKKIIRKPHPVGLEFKVRCVAFFFFFFSSFISRYSRY